MATTISAMQNQILAAFQNVLTQAACDNQVFIIHGITVGNLKYALAAELAERERMMEGE